MATESPLLVDSNTIAAANYFNPGSALSGPNGSGQFLAVKQSASADRTSTLANSGGEDILGILQNTPLQGDAAAVGFSGTSKAVVGAAVTRGDKLMTDTSARLITATTGNFVVAEALESGAGANDIITVLVRPRGKI